MKGINPHPPEAGMNYPAAMLAAGTASSGVSKN